MNPSRQGKQDKMEKAASVLQEHKKTLLGKPNVVGVGIGLQQTKGRHTGSVAVVVLVTQKVPREKLAESELIPHEIDGIPVDVQETGNITAFDS